MGRLLACGQRADALPPWTAATMNRACRSRMQTSTTLTQPPRLMQWRAGGAQEQTGKHARMEVSIRRLQAGGGRHSQMRICRAASAAAAEKRKMGAMTKEERQVKRVAKAKEVRAANKTTLQTHISYGCQVRG